MPPGRPRRRSPPGRSRRPGWRSAGGPRARWCWCRRAAAARRHEESERACRRGPGRTFWPVLSAFDRSTASVPSMTQNECWTPVSSATSTARAEADGAAHAVVQPDRVALDVSRRPLLGRRQRAGDAFRLAARACAASQLRRSAAAASGRCCPRSAETAKLSSWARKPGRAPRSRRGRGAVPAGRPLVRALVSASCASQLGERVGEAALGVPRVLGSAAWSSSTAAAAVLTRQAAVVDLDGSWWARCGAVGEHACSHRSSSTSRTTVRAAVLSPVGR